MTNEECKRLVIDVISRLDGLHLAEGCEVLATAIGLLITRVVKEDYVRQTFMEVTIKAIICGIEAMKEKEKKQ
jgi:hypothetical protein